MLFGFRKEFDKPTWIGIGAILAAVAVGMVGLGIQQQVIYEDLRSEAEIGERIKKECGSSYLEQETPRHRVYDSFTRRDGGAEKMEKIYLTLRGLAYAMLAVFLAMIVAQPKITLDMGPNSDGVKKLVAIGLPALVFIALSITFVSLEFKNQRCGLEDNCYFVTDRSLNGSNGRADFNDRVNERVDDWLHSSNGWKSVFPLMAISIVIWIIFINYNATSTTDKFTNNVQIWVIAAWVLVYILLRVFQLNHLENLKSLSESIRYRYDDDIKAKINEKIGNWGAKNEDGVMQKTVDKSSGSCKRMDLNTYQGYFVENILHADPTVQFGGNPSAKLENMADELYKYVRFRGTNCSAKEAATGTAEHLQRSLDDLSVDDAFVAADDAIISAAQSRMRLIQGGMYTVAIFVTYCLYHWLYKQQQSFAVQVTVGILFAVFLITCVAMWFARQYFI